MRQRRSTNPDRAELESVRYELALCAGEIAVIAEMATGRVNRALKLVGAISDGMVSKNVLMKQETRRRVAEAHVRLKALKRQNEMAARA